LGERSPDPLAGFKEPTTEGSEGERREWTEKRHPLYFFSADLYAHGNCQSG